MPSERLGKTLALLIPAYNAEEYLSRLLESSRRQSASFDEVLVYNDCSTDGTRAIAERKVHEFVPGDVNRGCTVGKNTLVAACRSDWMHFHDADDVILPNFVERAHRWMDADDADVVAFGCEECWEGSGERISLALPDDEYLASNPIRATITSKINAISGLYRRSRFMESGGFDLDPAVLFNEDQALHCHLARSGLRFRGDASVTVVNYRQRASMWVSNQALALQAHFHVMLKALNGPDGWVNRDVIAERLWHVAGGSAAHLDWATADAAALLAMRIWGPVSMECSPLFWTLCRLSPRFAVHAREFAIRTFKPTLRSSHPHLGARA